VKFLIDAQLPPVLADWLHQQGHEAQHIQAVGLQDADDEEVWDYAVRTGAVIVSKDEDFAERCARTTGGPVVVWFRVGNSTNRALLEWLQPRWSDLLMLLHAGNRLIEVR
jgi:predicted nuclease of predicted toxin-antitoxin system